MFKKRRPKSTVLEQELEQEEAYRLQLAALRVADNHGINRGQTVHNGSASNAAPAAQLSARDRLEGRTRSAHAGSGGAGRRSQRGRPLPGVPPGSGHIVYDSNPNAAAGVAPAPALPSRGYNREGTRASLSSTPEQKPLYSQVQPSMPAVGDGLYGENGQIDLRAGAGFGETAGDGFGGFDDSDEDADGSDYENSDVALRGGAGVGREMPPVGGSLRTRPISMPAAVPTPGAGAYPPPDSNYKNVRPVTMSRSPPHQPAQTQHDDREKENIRKWLRVAIERVDAQVCLSESGMMHGTYLVRKSAGGTYGLSICAGGSIFHMKVITEPNDDLELMWHVQGDKSPEREFKTIWELLLHYKKPTDRLKWHLTRCISWKYIPRGMLDI